MPFEIDRSLYARMYGPTTGDRVRLGDTNLLVEVERDEAQPGDETLWSFGKTIRSTGACCPVGCPLRASSATMPGRAAALAAGARSADLRDWES